MVGWESSRCNVDQQSTFILTAFPSKLGSHLSSRSVDDDGVSRQKALQTVVAGQQAENLLDFDDDTAVEGAPMGLAATTASLAATPAGTSFQTSSNPLDDLVSIFGSTGIGATPMLSQGPPPLASFNQPQQKPAAASQSDDLLGLF